MKDGESTIGRCINSLVSQTFENFELIIVDDASTDKTGKIIQGFKDERVKYFRNEKWSGLAKVGTTV